MKRILVTVGAQLPFSRLIKAIDAINKSCKHSILAQIGEDDNVYSNIETVRYLTSKEYTYHLENCDLVIAHAGMGTIIQCFEANRKLLIVPRLAAMQEHRNDHQLDTVSRFKLLTSNNSLMRVCENLDELETILEELINTDPSGNFFAQDCSDLNQNLGKYVRSLINNEV